MKIRRITTAVATMAATLILAGCGTPIMVDEAPSSVTSSTTATPTASPEPSPEHYVPQAEPSSSSEPAKVQVKPTTKPVEEVSTDPERGTVTYNDGSVETYPVERKKDHVDTETGVDDTMPDGPSKVVTAPATSDDKVTAQSVESEPSPEPVEEATMQPEPCTGKACKTAGNGSIGNGIDNRPKE